MTLTPAVATSGPRDAIALRADAVPPHEAAVDVLVLVVGRGVVPTWLDDYAEPIRVGEGPALPLVRRAIHTEASANARRRPAPMLGADTQDLLAQLGIGEPKLTELKAQGVI